MPGAGKQPPEVQAQIKELLEAGFDPTTIHRKLKVGRSSIYRMKRSLQTHGTAYMPTALNKKNGRPKVLTAEQELEVREWLRDPKNRNRYLDDLVWLIHDRFGIVCSTTTMSKLKRKWMRVIEAEETGQPLDEMTREQVRETHPDLPILLQGVDEETVTTLPSEPPQQQPLMHDQALQEQHQQRFQQHLQAQQHQHQQYQFQQPPQPVPQQQQRRRPRPRRVAEHQEMDFPIDARLLEPGMTPYYSTAPYPMPPQM